MLQRTSDPNGAIVGLALAGVGRSYERPALDLAEEAVIAATADAGLTLRDLDGLLVSAGVTNALDLRLRKRLRLDDLALARGVQSFGASACIMVADAVAAIEAGDANTVACVFADDPLRPDGRATYGTPAAAAPSVADLPAVAGATDATIWYALAARRHMARFGTTEADLGAVAVSTRQWATLNPFASFREPLSPEQYAESRWVCEPLRLLDCCMISNGAVAVIVTSKERAADLRRRPVHVLGYGSSSPAYRQFAGGDFGLTSGAAASSRAAYRRAGIGPTDVTVAELYDCYTFTTLLTLEDYGLCERGAAGELFRSGATAPGGRLPVNTGGGQLSGYYMWGMTPLSEAIVQVRGDGGKRQVPDSSVVVVSGNGGSLDYHSTLVLGPQQ